MSASSSSATGSSKLGTRARYPRGAVRRSLVRSALELARTGGPDAVVLREAARMVGVVPNAAYRHFADRDALLACVCTAAMHELGARMAADVESVGGRHGANPGARDRLRAVGHAYIDFARHEPGLFATAFALPRQHPYEARDDASSGIMPLDQLRRVLDELVEAGALDAARRDGLEYPIWATMHGLATLTVQGPLRAASPDGLRRLDELTRDFVETVLAD